jgi:hypothetical protein
MPLTPIPIRILALMSDDVAVRKLRSTFAAADVYFASSLTEALLFHHRQGLPVMVSDHQPSGAGVQGIFVSLEYAASPPLLIVVPRLSDDQRLWTDVLGSGSYDLLRIPLNLADLRHALATRGAAWGAPGDPVSPPHPVQ